MIENVAEPLNPRWLSRPLAIVGMACRLPGADDLDSFWELLRSGGYAIERMPESKIDRQLYFDSRKGVRGKTYSDKGGFVRERDRDWSVLPLDPAEVGDWDECHLNLCEVAAQACVHAGYDPRNLPTRNASVFVGHSGGSTLGGELAYRTLSCDYVQLLDEVADWQALNDASAAKAELLEQLQAGRPQRHDAKPYVDASCAAGLISRTLGLTGPSMSIDAACASSLVALALGANSLQSGHSQLSIVGGASLNKADSLILFSQAQSCSSQASRPFDQQADGLISSEGYVTILLKTLEQAEADGDSIQAVIRGIGISSDGRGRSLWAPRKEGQCEAIRRAYCDEVRPESVQLIEAHATSTQVGDATEMEALANFYGEHLPNGARLPVGSVKSNIGHTLETAGLAGLLKTILAMQHQVIPPSVNVERLSDAVPWEDIPLYVARQAEPWPVPDSGTARRAAVNAFGIGGLNVHVVVDEYSASTGAQPQSRQPRQWNSRVVPASNEHCFEPIAIVGRGLVIPGVRGVEEFLEFLQHPTSQIKPPPPERARFHDENWIEGGYINDFHYDWRRHKVPPKQIAQANPLQFMLLDAAEQALQEAGLLASNLDRQHTAVVVGSPFGGDFGHALYAGLRLPELKAKLTSVALAHGRTESQIEALWREYEAAFLREYPALLDETGSFTSSTLASRLSKTFNLMGGALSVDAGVCSGMAALYAGCQLLQSGAANQVLCAAAHRALDRANIESLRLRGLLRFPADDSSNLTAGIPGKSSESGGNSHGVGEGVALLLLKRGADAERAGDRCYATIDDITCGFDAASVQRTLEQAATRHQTQASRDTATFGRMGIPHIDQAIAAGLHSQNALDSDTPHRRSLDEPRLSKNQPFTGHLQAVQGLVDIIATSCDPEPRLSRIASWAPSGQSYLASVSVGHASADVSQSDVRQSLESLNRRPATSAQMQSAQIQSAQSITTKIEPPPMHTFRFESETANGLAALLNEVANKSADELRQLSIPTGYFAKDSWRAAIVCSVNELGEKAKRLAPQIEASHALTALAEQAMFCSSPSSRVSKPKIAWLFPGQGSQYPGMLKNLIEADPFAADRLKEANRILADMDQPSFEELAWNPENQLGEDVWYTQAAMLVTDWIIDTTLRNRGFSPTLVSGHSFGEFAALLSAGCWDLPSALLATWHRCQAIAKFTPPGCAMLSIQSERSNIQVLIDSSETTLAISHLNAPQQTVVGGKQAAIARFAQVLEDEGIASRILPVPTAFHTPSLTGAVEPFLSALNSIPIEPPKTPVLSNITNAYAADPAQIRRALADQLVRPADFIGLVERLVSDGVTLAVEVGPQQVLSKLVRQNIGHLQTENLTIIATDHTKRGCATQLLCAQAVMELHQPNQELAMSPRISTSAEAENERTAQPTVPVHFDATKKRRDRVRAAAGASAIHDIATERSSTSHQTAHFDATTARKQSRRAMAGMSAKAPPPESLHARPIERAVTGHVDVPKESVPQDSEVLALRQPPSGSEVRMQTAAIEQFLIDFVVEQTGYPAEIIELDWDIEADLGIDSIKKAQLFGELREFFELEVHQGMSLDMFVTLRDIVDLLEKTPGKGAWLGAEVESPQLAISDAPPAKDLHTGDTLGTSEQEFTSPKPWNNDAVASHSPSGHIPPATPIPGSDASNSSLLDASAPATGSADAGELSIEELTGFLVDFVVEQTGYPPEIVELDADLEADLGIDSIKKAQLLGELREMFSLQLDSLQSSITDRRAPALELATLRQILDFLIANQATTNSGLTADVRPPVALISHTSGSPSPVQPTSGQTQSDAVAPVNASKNDFASKQDSFPPSDALRSDASRSAAFTDAASVSPQTSKKTANTVPTAELPSTDQTDTAPPSVRLPRFRVASAGGHSSAGQPSADQGFVQSARQHIMAMAAGNLQSGTPVDLAAGNGLATWYEKTSRQLATACAISQQSVRAFDSTLQEQARWEPTANVSQQSSSADCVHEQPPSDEKVTWLLELNVPNWLAGSSGELLGIRQSNLADSESEALIIPGAILPTVCLRGENLLLAAGCNGDHSAASGTQIKLAAFLESSSAISLSAVADEARNLGLSTDWWLLAADAKTSNLLWVTSRRGELCLEKSRLDESSLAGSGSAKPAAARLGLDIRQGCFVIDAQARPYPIARTRIEWRSGKSVVDGTVPPEGQDSTPEPNALDRVASRYVLRMSPSPARPVSGRQPHWCGAALVVGDNPVSRQLCARLKSAGVETFSLAGNEDPSYLSKEFTRLTSESVIPHLFIATPWDADAAVSLDSQAWKSRRSRGLLGNFWLCQKWLAHIVDSGLANDASLVAITSLGGDFGISGNIYSVEGGGLTGLMKSMMIESWTHGIRPLPIKILDCPPTQSPAEIVSNVWHELAVPSYDFEVAYRDGLRHVVRAIPRPAPPSTRPIPRGGTWICTGGARGITAFVAEQLALRYDLKLHLVGTAPVPSIEPDWRDLDETGLRALKATIMTTARTAGQNPVKTWQDTEKALEIDATLRRLQQAGIEAYYHSCDISDRASLAKVMQDIHSQSGPVQGVLHGAGVGKDSRFDRKQPEKVDQCIAAKVDGALALMDATQNDPLEYFIGFGSISGRFGANGHTDYSLANEMLCKQIAWFSKQRPEVKAVGFHWHAWGDVGMATKPETRLALEMIDMQFMPANEGLAHLIGELESESDEREILITDDRYYRMFFPAETLVSANKQAGGGVAVMTPLLKDEVRPACGGDQAFSCVVDPTRDPFLTEHLLDGKPLLPFVVASEMLLEAGTKALGTQALGTQALGTQALGTTHTHLRDVEATGALRFFSERKLELRLETKQRTTEEVECCLYSDFLARDGRLVEANRCNFRAIACLGEPLLGKTRVQLQPTTQWHQASYPGVDAKFYAGWPLQRLRKVAIVEHGLVGEICAPALIELAGSDRRVQGWRIPSAAMDACLFATGILAWQQVAAGVALPVRIQSLAVGRLPDPGEACQVHVQLDLTQPVTAGRAAFNFTLYGVDDEILMDARGYEVAWLGGDSQTEHAKLSSGAQGDIQPKHR